MERLMNGFRGINDSPIVRSALTTGSDVAGRVTSTTSSAASTCGSAVKAGIEQVGPRNAAIGAGAVVGSVALVSAFPAFLGYLGFTGAGIAGKSTAAGWMSSAAIANGGGVAAGSAVAVLQSVGAAGVGLAGASALAVTGGVAGAGTAAALANKSVWNGVKWAWGALPEWRS